MPTQSTSENAGPLPQGTRIGRTALRVNDLDELTEFYRDIVGLNVLSQSDTRAQLGAGETTLLVLEENKNTRQRHRSGAGLYHNAFRVPSRAALGDALARVRNQWQLGGASSHGVSEALYLTDPEGNGIEIYRDFPRKDWPVADDGNVRIGTYSLDLEPIQAAASGEPTVPADTDVGHIHLEVTSMEFFRDFYVDTLGFEEQTTVPAASFVSAGGYHHHIGANMWHHRKTPRDGRGLLWFEVLVPEQQTLDTIRDRFEAREIPVTVTDEGIEVTDPDGIKLRLQVEPSNSFA